MKKRVALILVGLALVVAAGAAILTLSGKIEAGRAGHGLLPAAQRVALDGAQIQTRDGVLDLSVFQGRATLVAVWASWCGPCIQSIPRLVGLQERFGRELTVIGLNVDTDGWPAVERIQKAFPEVNYLMALPFPKPLILRTIVNLEPLGQVSVLPTAFLVDSEGRLAAKYVGSSAETRIADDIQALLDSGAVP